MILCDGRPCGDVEEGGSVAIIVCFMTGIMKTSASGGWWGQVAQDAMIEWVHVMGEGPLTSTKGLGGGAVERVYLGFEQMDINICFGEEASRGPKHESVLFNSQPWPLAVANLAFYKCRLICRCLVKFDVIRIFWAEQKQFPTIKAKESSSTFC